MKNKLPLFLLLILAFNLQAQKKTIDFESSKIQYVWSDFAGGVASVVDNPDASGINKSSKVGKMVKFAAEKFGGSTLALSSALSFDNNKTISMKVWANRTKAPILLKLEGPTPVEVSAVTTVANKWEVMTFDFTGLDQGFYTGITIIYDIEVLGNGSSDFTFYFDDLVYSIGDRVPLPLLPIDFESPGIKYRSSDFAGGAVSITNNPDATGLNTSPTVGRMVKFAGEKYGGSTLALGSGLAFGKNTSISMKVWANRAGAPILFKLEGPVPMEVSARTTAANRWHELTFDFTGLTQGIYSGITLIYDLGVTGDGSPNFTFYFDDIRYAAGDGIARPVLPIDFESTNLVYEWTDFEGGVASLVKNPDASGFNTSNRVGRMIKHSGADFAGSALTLGGGVDFGANTKISMKVWANRTDVPVLLKLEGPIPAEVAASTTVEKQWEELSFDFTGFTGGLYNKITVIYDLGVVGNGSADFTLYFDDIKFLTPLESANFTKLDFELYLNPTTNVLNINTRSTIDQVTVYSLSGRRVIDLTARKASSKIDVSDLSPGTYTLRVLTTANEEGVAKFVKR